MKRTVKTIISAAIITVLASVMMLMGTFTANAAVIRSDTLECGVSWELTDDGTLTFSGSGPLLVEDTERQRVWRPWWNDNFTNNVKKVVIGEGITEIGKAVLDDHNYITSVSLPSTLRVIGERAFKSCQGLKEIELPYGLEEIGDYAFIGCYSLDRITISENVEVIGKGAFSCCGVRGIDVDPYNKSYCTINDVLLCSKDGKTLYQYVGNSVKEYTIPDGIETVGSHAFRGLVELQRIVVPESVKTIETDAFYFCDALRCVLFKGSETQWNRINMGENANIAKSTLYYNYIPGEMFFIEYDRNEGNFFMEVYGEKGVDDGPREKYRGQSVKITNKILLDRETYYVFKSWNTKPDGSGDTYYPDGIYSKDEDVTFYAQFRWEPPKARVAGETRVDTAVEISKQGWNVSEYAVIAYGMNYADALAASPLAAGLDCPVLLTANQQSGLESTVRSELSRLGAKKVYLIGGKYVISESIEASLKKSLGSANVVRLAGTGRYETSIEIAKELQKIRQQKGMGNFTNAYFCSAGSFADALAISPVAGIELNPILYAPQKGQSLKQANAAMYNFVGKLGIKNTTIIGGIYAVSTEAASDLQKITGKAPERVDAGLTGGRYETMLKVCERYKTLFAHHHLLCFSTGENFPDALAGASLAAKHRCPIILVGNTSPAVDSAVVKLVNYLNPIACYTFGGEYAVPDARITSLLGDNTQPARRFEHEPVLY